MTSTLPAPTATNLPVNTPAEVIAISPEGLEIANCYLQNPSIPAVAEALDIPREQVTVILAQREVKAYIDSVFFNTGFNNRFQMRNLMDTIIQKKLKDMDEGDIGSSKDITEILALSHKMTMELMDKEIQLEKTRSGAGKVVTNIQVNNDAAPPATRYGQLLEKLMTGDIVDV